MQKGVSHKQKTLLRAKTPTPAILIFQGIFVTILYQIRENKI